MAANALKSVLPSAADVALGRSLIEGLLRELIPQSGFMSRRPSQTYLFEFGGTVTQQVKFSRSGAIVGLWSEQSQWAVCLNAQPASTFPTGAQTTIWQQYVDASGSHGLQQVTKLNVPFKADDIVYVKATAGNIVHVFVEFDEETT